MIELELSEMEGEYFMVNVNPLEYDWQEKQTHPPSVSPWKEMVKWCQEKFGYPDPWGEENISWKYMGPKFFFTKEESRTLFLIRWSQ